MPGASRALSLLSLCYQPQQKPCASLVLLQIVSLSTAVFLSSHYHHPLGTAGMESASTGFHVRETLLLTWMCQCGSCPHSWMEWMCQCDMFKETSVKPCFNYKFLGGSQCLAFISSSGFIPRRKYLPVYTKNVGR